MPELVDLSILLLPQGRRQLGILNLRGSLLLGQASGNFSCHHGFDFGAGQRGFFCPFADERPPGRSEEAAKEQAHKETHRQSPTQRRRSPRTRQKSPGIVSRALGNQDKVRWHLPVHKMLFHHAMQASKLAQGTRAIRALPHMEFKFARLLRREFVHCKINELVLPFRAGHGVPLSSSLRDGPEISKSFEAV